MFPSRQDRLFMDFYVLMGHQIIYFSLLVYGQGEERHGLLNEHSVTVMF